jgi:hypothetical protein
MTTKVFLNHLVRINKDELPCLSPRFDDSQKLFCNEIIDIIIHGIPRKWAWELE